MPSAQLHRFEHCPSLALSFMVPLSEFRSQTGWFSSYNAAHSVWPVMSTMWALHSVLLELTEKLVLEARLPHPLQTKNIWVPCPPGPLVWAGVALPAL